MRVVFRVIQFFAELTLVPILCVLAAVARVIPKRIDVGLGPEPLINYIYHKRALTRLGYTAETFVSSVYFITDEFDIRADRFWSGKNRVVVALALLRLWFLAIRRYRCVYHSFWGSPLAPTMMLHRLDPFLYKLAGVKVVILPYGGDVQELTRSPNLYFKHTYGIDYPSHRFRRRRIGRQIDRWTAHANHVVSGCDWVDYMYHWDTLMLGHFAIDTDDWMPNGATAKSERVSVLHAPNHRALKGSDHIELAVRELQKEGVPVDLVLLQGVPNDKIREAISQADIVADQLVVGWYAMFAIEAMVLGKPVLCYLRDDLKELFVDAELVGPEEIPIVNCHPGNVKQKLRMLVDDCRLRESLGCRGREFVAKHHSLESVGRELDKINRLIGLEPTGTGF